MWQTAAALISALVGMLGLCVGWFQWRKSELRSGDVLAWATEVIRSLQSLLLICSLRPSQLGGKAATDRLTHVIFDTAALVEIGRLFFKNEPVPDHGQGKLPAYRGYRPKILDPIVVAHQIAKAWSSADEDERLRMRIIAEECLKKFVSLVQQEVGRSRTASADTKVGGDGAPLRHLLGNVDNGRLEQLKAAER